MDEKLEKILKGIFLVPVVVVHFGIFSYFALAMNNGTLNPREIYRIEKSWSLEKKEMKREMEEALKYESKIFENYEKSCQKYKQEILASHIY